MWILLGLFSALLLGLYDICKKHAVKENAVLPVLLTATLCGSGVMVPILLLNLLLPGQMEAVGMKMAPLGMTEHLMLLGKAGIVSASWILAYFALKHLPISIVSPIRASAPLWTLLGALVLFAERPTPWQWLGLVIIFVSYYAFSVLGNQEGIEFRRNRWVSFIFLATLIGSASALYDKYLLQRCAFTPLTLQVWFSIYLVLLLGLVVGIFWWPRRKTLTPFRWRWSIPLIGTLLIAADFLYFTALHDKTALIALLSAIRRSSVVISFVVGGLLFRERNKRKKSLALLGVLAGVFIILFS